MAFISTTEMERMRYERFCNSLEEDNEKELKKYKEKLKIKQKNELETFEKKCQILSKYNIPLDKLKDIDNN